MHERDVTVAARTCAGELGLALGNGGAVPVLCVNVVRDDLVAESLHRALHRAAGLEVRGAHVCWLLPQDVDIGLLELLHLGS